MTSPAYVLPVEDENGVVHEVELDDGDDGYLVLGVDDENGVTHLLDNAPASAPPTGELPVDDEDDVEHDLAFMLAEVTGLYELSSNAVRGVIDQAITNINDGDGQDLHPLHPLLVSWDNADFDVPSPTSQTKWAAVTLAFEPEEQVGFGAGNKYRVRGEALIALRVPIGRGDLAALEIAVELKGRLRDQVADPATFEEPWHSPVQRDGVWWRVDLHCPFRADLELAVPSGSSGGAPTVVEAHNLIRAFFNDEFATPEGIVVAWDNAAPAQPDTAIWCRATILTGTAREVDRASVRRRRYVGLLKVAFMLPLGTMDRDGWRLVDTLADRSRAASRGGVRFQPPSARSLGRRGRAWVIAVDVPFRAEELA